MGESEHLSSPISKHTTMHRQLILSLALCTLMCAMHATSVDSELESAADVAGASGYMYRFAGAYRQKQKRKRYGFSKVTKSGSTYTLKYTSKSGKVYTYHQRKCKKTYKKSRSGKMKYTTAWCKMCREAPWRSRYRSRRRKHKGRSNIDRAEITMYEIKRSRRGRWYGRAFRCLKNKKLTYVVGCFKRGFWWKTKCTLRWYNVWP